MTNDHWRNRLFGAIDSGECIDLLSGLQPSPFSDLEAMEDWGKGHDIEAKVLRTVLLESESKDATDPRGLQLRGVRIVGRLDLRHAKITTPLTLSSCLLEEGFSAYAAQLSYLNIEHSYISSSQDVPIDAKAASFQDDFRLVKCAVKSANEEGAVVIGGATVGGDLEITGSRLQNDVGIALSCDGVEVEGGLWLDSGFEAEGVGAQGTVSLIRAHINDALVCTGSKLVNKSGPALHADALDVDGTIYMGAGFSAEGGDERGAVRMVGARVRGQLELRDAQLCNPRGMALDVTRSEVRSAALLDGQFTAEGGGDGPTVDLSDASFGLLKTKGAKVSHSADASRCWLLDGATYRGEPDVGRIEWLDRLRRSTPYYAAQPYQHLASLYRALGHESDVKVILISQRQDQMIRGNLGWAEKAWARFTGLVLGYGWRPGRALILLGICFALSVSLNVLLGEYGALVHPPRPNSASENCSMFERVGVGLDLGTPLIGSITRVRDRCAISTDSSNSAVRALLGATWALQALAWGSAALFVAGFTGAVRKT